MLPADGVNSIGEGMLEVDEELLQGLLVKQDINEIYEVEQTPFARGKFAAVRRAIHKRSGVHFAAKFLKRRRRAQSSDKEIKHEIAVLILCSGCDNIVKLNAVHETRSDTALLLELATGGELQAILDDEGCLTEAKTRICMRQVLKALQFLHKRSIAHLDLKPQNILLTGSRVEDGLKLCDFGISRVIESGSKIREILGTPDYVAPEVLQYEPLSLLTDIWSVGVLTYVLLSGCSPFGGDTKQETFLNISQCALTFPDELFDGVSNHAIDFIKSTLRIKPNDRMSAFECLEHIWLKDESPMGGNSYLTMSRAAVDVREKNKDTSNGSSAENDYENSNNSKYQLFTQSPPISTPATAKMHHDIDENSTKYKNSQNFTSLRSNNDIDSDEHDKENFLTNSSTNNGYSSPNNYNTNRIGSIVSNLSSKSKQIPISVSATAKLSSTAIKYGSSRFVNSDSCTLIKGLATHHHTSYHHSHRQQHHQNSHQHQNGYQTNGTCDIDVPVLNGICGGLNKSSSSMTSTSVDAVGSSSAGQTLNKSMTAAATICLFPDAPTTPKVIRKAPSESPKSVKALVKKFQLESGDYSPQNSSHSTNLLSMSPASNGHDDESMKKLNCQSSLSNRISPASINASSSSPSSSNGCSSTCSNSNNNNSNSNNNNISISDDTTSSNGRNFKSTCVFCLSCAGPGCRHSGRGNVSKSTGTIGLDQGIIC